MATPPKPIEPPVFVLCCARSGSTLLRHILDAHSDVCCPPELHLVGLATRLHWVYTYTADPGQRLSLAERRQAAIGKVRGDINRIMNQFTLASGKKMWCEKSVYTSDTLGFVKALYPDARYICLYRNSLDVVHSALETLKTDPMGTNYGFTPFLSVWPNNPISALVDYWCAKNSTILEFERHNTKNSFRIQYENLVREPEHTLNELFGFLGLTFSNEIIDSVFAETRDTEPGDPKFSDTRQILTDRIGKGTEIDTSAIPERLRRSLNSIERQLEYPSTTW